MNNNKDEFEDLADDFSEDTGPSIAEVNRMYDKAKMNEAIELLETCLSIFNNLPNKATTEGDTYQMAAKIDKWLERQGGKT